MSKEISLDTVVGVKAGMTRIFDKDGNHCPVTVVKLIDNFVSQVKTPEKDGYSAYQVGFGRGKKQNKVIGGTLKKANIEATLNKFYEIRLNEVSADNLGAKVRYESFNDGTWIDVTGVSKGKGFQGVMKKYGFQGGPATHGSHFHRRGGSIGNRATPGKVFANKKMPGQMGDKKITVQNLQVMSMNLEKGYLLIRGSVPGSKNSLLKISKALKKV